MQPQGSVRSATSRAKGREPPTTQTGPGHTEIPGSGPTLKKGGVLHYAMPMQGVWPSPRETDTHTGTHSRHAVGAQDPANS